jgi:uncharacterized Ntn-hydrolase superfamily protein
MAILTVGLASRATAQDTFSIVALDTVTGEVGSAGASCISGSAIISDVHPGIGAVHTQAYYVSGNQDYASSLMDDGHTPSEILDSLHKHDVQGKPAFRQYGIVTLLGPEHAAGFTGDSCMDYKNHIVGPYYSIQGNILKGRIVLDQIKSRFLAAKGPLADRLMAALQGANMPGADKRCLADGTSSKSSFLRVANSTDMTVDLVVYSVPKDVEPIDTLQRLYNSFKSQNGVALVSETAVSVRLDRNPMHDQAILTVTGVPDLGYVSLDLINAAGKRERTITMDRQTSDHTAFATIERDGLAAGVYFYRIYATRKAPIAIGELVIQ